VPTSTESSFFFDFFSLINIGWLCVLSMSVCSGVALQSAHCAVSLKILTAASISSSVLREAFEANLVDEASEVFPICMSIA
jgi:hypothetical protein